MNTLKRRVREDFSGYKSQRLLWRAIEKYGVESIVTEVLYQPSVECLSTFEMLAIRQERSHHTQSGYNVTWGGDGVDSDIARDNAYKQFRDGTHPFLDKDFYRKVGEKNRQHGLRRVQNGTHHFLDPEFYKEHRQSVCESAKRRVDDGTHPFLDREAARKRALRRVQNGTHHFLDPEFREKATEGARKCSRRRIEDGTHPFLSNVVRSRRLWKCRLALKARRRELYRIYAALLVSRSVLLEYRQRQLQREGFFDKDILDTSGAVQVELF